MAPNTSIERTSKGRCAPFGPAAHVRIRVETVRNAPTVTHIQVVR